MCGRDSLEGAALWRWADEGEKWLNEQFPGKGLEFHTGVDVPSRMVKLTVFHRPGRSKKATQVFEVTERIESFVSHLTVTKIILIAG